MDQLATVHIIDDDDSICRAVSTLLRSVSIASRSYSSCDLFLNAAIEDGPGCLLLDVRLPGLSGLDFQAQLAAHCITMPVIMMTGYGDVPMSVQAMKAGAVDFLTKPFREQYLLDAVSSAIERDVRQREVREAMAELNARYQGLSERERQVMALVTSGRLNKQAAFDLGLSEITIKLYRASAMKKMMARTLPDFVKMAEKLQIAAPPFQ